MKKLNKQNGITLIALVITIIVMLILVAVTISMAVNGGLFNYAGKATGETQNAINAEQELANGRIKVGDYWYDSVNEYLAGNISDNQGEDGTSTEEKVDLNTSYVLYYADTNNDGTVDGIIYADLAVGGSGNWGDVSYTIEPETGFKEYYISKKNYKGPFGTKDVVSTKEKTGKDRFYVMALTDHIENTTIWYYENVDGDADFGKGKTYTEGMTTLSDFTTKFGDKVNQGWFIPSKVEFAVFGNALSLNSTKKTEYGLADYYGMSSGFASGYMGTGTYGYIYPYFLSDGGFDSEIIFNSTEPPADKHVSYRLSITF